MEQIHYYGAIYRLPATVKLVRKFMPGTIAFNPMPEKFLVRWTKKDFTGKA